MVVAAGSGMGFCPDYSPDKNVGVATERLLVGSQDVASDFSLLRELGVTHIVNTVSSMIPCAFPQVSYTVWCVNYNERVFHQSAHRIISND